MYSRTDHLYNRLLRALSHSQVTTKLWGILDSGSVDRHPGSGRPCTAHTHENVILLLTSGSLMGVYAMAAMHIKTRQSVCEFFSKNTGIRRSSVWSLHFQSRPPKRKQRASSVANVFSGSEATLTKVRWGNYACVLEATYGFRHPVRAPGL